MKIRKDLLVILLVIIWGGNCLAVVGAAQPAKVALIGFKVDSSLDQALADKLRLLIFAQISTSDKLVMLERKHLKKIMAEHNLSMSGLVSAKSQLRLGLLAGAEFVVSGRIYQMDDKLYINAKAINAKTTKVFGLFRSYKKSGKTDSSLEKFAEAITRKLVEKLDKPQQSSSDKVAE